MSCSCSYVPRCSCRPAHVSSVPLRYFVYDYACASNEWSFDSGLNARVLELIAKHAKGRPCLVFCATQKGTTACAEAILKSAAAMNKPDIFVTSEKQKRQLQDAATKMPDGVRRMIQSGVGIHHGNMNAKDRAMIEAMFKASQLGVVW